MADESASFAIELRDETSGPAEDAALALAQLRDTIAQTQAGIRGATSALAQMRAGGLGNSAAAQLLTARIKEQRAAVARMQQQYLELGGTFAKITPRAEASGTSIKSLGDALKQAPGPVGPLTGKIEALVKSLGAMPTLAIAGAAALGVLAVAMGAAALAVLRYAAAQSDARRSELLRLEGIVRLRRAHGDAAETSASMQAAIDRVADSTGLGRDEIGRYAEQLARGGVRGRAFATSLEAAGIAASAAGDEAAGAFARQAIAANRAGRAVDGLAKSVRERLGGVAARQALSFDRQMTRLRENIGRIFDGLRIEAFLGGLNTVLRLFSQSTATGRALRSVVTAIFGPAATDVSRLTPMVRDLFRGATIAALRLTIVFLRVRNALYRALGGRDILGNVDAIQVGMYAFTAVLAVAATVATALALAIVVVGAALLAANAPIIAAGLAIYGLWRAGVAAYEGLASIDWSDLGRSMIDGLVGGLRRGQQLVAETVRGLAASAQTAFRDALGIRSPSRVFAELGLQIPRGIEQGIDAGSDRATGAAASAVDVPSGSALAGASSATTVSISFGDIIVQGDGGREQAQSFVDQVVELLGGAGIHMAARAS